MEKLFFPSSGPAYRDFERIVRRVRVLAARVCAERPEVEEVILFGSYSGGRPGYFSDLDLVVIVRDDSRRPHERVPEYLLLFQDAPLPVDLFVFTRDEVAARESAADPFMREILRRGIRIAPESRDGDGA